jgi:hypothetical protein
LVPFCCGFRVQGFCFSGFFPWQGFKFPPQNDGYFGQFCFYLLSIVDAPVLFFYSFYSFFIFFLYVDRQFHPPLGIDNKQRAWFWQVQSHVSECAEATDVVNFISLSYISCYLFSYNSFDFINLLCYFLFL